MGRTSGTWARRRLLGALVAGVAIPLAGLATVSASAGYAPNRPAPVNPAPATCPRDPDRFDARIPPREPGVNQSSRDGQNGPLGAQIVGAGVANPYYEISTPTDGHKADPLGVMLVIHGGGWVQVGPGSVAMERPDADFWRAHGWETINIDYRGCEQSIDDVDAFYSRVRQVVGGEMPICATGKSAGGTLALLLAAKVGPNGLACVIAQAGITDINALASQSAFPSGNPHVRSATLLALAQAAFGTTAPAALATFSPITDASTFTTPALLAIATNDVLVPQSQATTFRDAVLRDHPNAVVDVDELPCPPSGPLRLGCHDTELNALHTPNVVHFIHGMTTEAGFNQFRADELDLTDMVLTSTH